MVLFLPSLARSELRLLLSRLVLPFATIFSFVERLPLFFLGSPSLLPSFVDRAVPPFFLPRVRSFVGQALPSFSLTERTSTQSACTFVLERERGRAREHPLPSSQDPRVFRIIFRGWACTMHSLFVLVPAETPGSMIWSSCSTTVAWPSAASLLFLFEYSETPFQIV